jgi:cell division protein FtsW
MEDSIYSLRHRDILALCVLGLLCLGIVMVQSASMQVTNNIHWQWSSRGTKHLMFAACAFAAFFAIGNLPYRILARENKRVFLHPILLCFLTACLACILVLIPHIGMTVNGARRWLPLGPIQVQPSELAKWGTVLFLAWWLSARPVNLDRFWGFALTLIPIAFICLLIVIQDFGTAALIGLCSVCMLLIGRVKLWHLAIVIPPALLAAFWFVHHEPYRWRRMTAFLDPWASSQKEGYHMIQSLLSFSTGGIPGRGIGNGIQKLGYLPEDTTDFIFAVICEELGLFGALLTVAFYMGIVFVAWQVVRKDRDDFGRLLAFGVATMTGLQAAINIAVATVSVPTKGLSLPLVSAGGSGLVITCAALGLVYSVMKHDPALAPPPTVAEEPDLLFVDPPAPDPAALDLE